jgi:hypothetical protein
MNPKGPWSNDEAERFLDDSSVPARLACNGTTGFPVLSSLWFLREEGQLWCATQRTSSAATLLAKDPNCAFEVSPETLPYRGLRGQGVATLHEERGEEILRRLVERYLGDSMQRLAETLLARSATEVAIAIKPLKMVTWDFSDRMADTV